MTSELGISPVSALARQLLRQLLKRGPVYGRDQLDAEKKRNINEIRPKRLKLCSEMPKVTLLFES